MCNVFFLYFLFIFTLYKTKFVRLEVLNYVTDFNAIFINR